MLFALIILLSQALAIQANLLRSDKSGDDIEAFCARKTVDLTTFEQLKSLQQSAHSSSCADTTKEALGVLVRTIESGKEDLCSVESIEALRGFYAKYLDTSVEKNREKLPKSLRRFVIAYGMEMSNLCKRNMIEILSQRGRDLLTGGDFEQVEQLTDDKGPVAQMLGSFIGPDDFFTPADLAPFFRSSQRGGATKDQVSSSDKLFIQTSTGPYVRKLQAVCARRFKPVYEPLMMPISRLANMGFNYKDETLKKDLHSSDVAHEVGLWARIVFMCEALNMIHIVEDPADQDTAEGTGLKLVRVVTEAEAAAIEETSGHKVQSEADDALEMAVYSPQKKVLLGNEIYDRKNKKLVEAVKSFKTSKTEAENFKRKIMKKGVSVIRHKVKQGQFKFLISTGYKGLMQHFKGEQAMTPSQELVKVLNEIEASKDEPTDGAVSAQFGVEYNEDTGSVFGAVITLVCLAIMVYVIYLIIASLVSAIG